MKIDLSKMTDAQIKEMARRFREAPCIVCGAESTGYRKLHLGSQQGLGNRVAFLPLCDNCQEVDAHTLMQFMEFADYQQSNHPHIGVGNTYRGGCRPVAKGQDKW